MDIELVRILSAAYEYTCYPHMYDIFDPPFQQENVEARGTRTYINKSIESYCHERGYTYNSETKEWTTEAKKADIARRRTQGAKDGWEIRRGKQRGKQ